MLYEELKGLEFALPTGTRTSKLLTDHGCEMTMTTWIMQNVGHSAEIAAEFAMRVESLREGDGHRAWHAF